MKNNDLTLLIMAAGMGSRFGGLKQIEPIGPNGEFLIDYSIYDAIKAGFTKVVFIIKEENYEIFKETVGKRIEKSIEVEYAFQSLSDIPSGYEVPEGRKRPWGTGHAILSARDIIKNKFAVINADDFYGRDAYFVVADFLKNEYPSNTYSIVGYDVVNTLTENGAVKRGVCTIKDRNLVNLIESNVIEENGEIVAAPLDGRESFTITRDTKVSMNMLGFNTSLFTYLEDNFSSFLEKSKENPLDCEYLIPDLLIKAKEEGYANVEVLDTSAEWKGVTYPEDKEGVVTAISDLIKSGEYPQNLWEK